MIDELMEIARDPSLLAPQRRRVTSRLGWIFGLATIAGHLVYMASAESLALPTLVVPLFVVGFFSVPVVLRRGGSLSLAIVLLLVFLVAAVVGLPMVTGGLGSPTLVLLMLPPITAIFLAGVRTAWATGLATVAGLVLIGLLDAAEILPAATGGWPAALAHGLLVVWVGSLVLALSGFYERQLARLRRKLRDAATTDPLTGLANRGSLDDALALEHHRLARYPDSCLSLILFDVDYFRDYNDWRGHQAGDEVLQRIAETARLRVRRAPDVLGRFGDDQMLAILPATSAGDAAILADCIRRDIEELALPHERSPHGVVTVSLGVVAEDASNRGSIDSLLSDAEQALVQAKESDRNSVVAARRSVDPAS